MYGNNFYFDPMYFVFVIPAMLLALYAQSRVRSSYSKWSQVGNTRGINGVDVARNLLPSENMSDVQVEMSQGQLSDHYDPSNNILRLSPEVAQNASIASMSIAAHEIGHAAQDRDGYVWMKLRAGIVPFISLGSSIGYLVFLAGLLGQIPSIAWIGILLLSGGAIFSLVTLPVEFDASNRAIQMLENIVWFRVRKNARPHATC
jgi:uncharacterized protein